MTFKFKLGQQVVYWEENFTIVQLRVTFNRPYYRLNDGRVISEMFLNG